MQYYKKTGHTIYDCTYHKVLIGDIGRRAKDLVQENCGDNGVEILSGKVASNHVHIYVSVPPPIIWFFCIIRAFSIPAIFISKRYCKYMTVPYYVIIN
ncbi:MAG: transposase [Rickettsiaceae bacterium]|nr:transposase [Rickettsiaceae bacterium]